MNKKEGRFLTGDWKPQSDSLYPECDFIRISKHYQHSNCYWVEPFKDGEIIEGQREQWSMDNQDYQSYYTTHFGNDSTADQDLFVRKTVHLRFDGADMFTWQDVSFSRVG